MGTVDNGIASWPHTLSLSEQSLRMEKQWTAKCQEQDILT